MTFCTEVRVGCYTCRLRRKKCDEVNPSCSACKNLGLDCEYKRPIWWGDNEYRRRHKDDIKVIIKQKKLTEKGHRAIATAPVCDLPSEILHSTPTSACQSKNHTHSRSTDRNFSSQVPSTIYTIVSEPPTCEPIFKGPSRFKASYPEVSVQSEDVIESRVQILTGDNLLPTNPIISDSNADIFSNTTIPVTPLTSQNAWIEEVHALLVRPDPNNYEFDLCTYSNHLTIEPSRQYALNLSNRDCGMLDHFVDFVVPLLFPVLGENYPGSQINLIMSALQNNPSYVHCCLSTAAQHFKSTLDMPSVEVDDEIMRHRYATIHALCDALAEDKDHAAILEATLGVISFQCMVGTASDDLPDIPWHQHFGAAISLVQKLNLPRFVLDERTVLKGTPFNMTLAAHIDILGATMLGQAPAFAHLYREKHLSTVNTSLGLRELTGCDDRVLYLISEIACLEALKRDGMDDIHLCNHVSSLGGQIGTTESGDNGPKLPFNGRGVLNATQLSKNITSAFRLAARIYLCSLVPGFRISSESCVNLLDRLSQVLEFVPSGLGGFDKSLTWVYLIGGTASMEGSNFRHLFEERIALLKGCHDIGSLGKLDLLLREVWSQINSDTDAPLISWRDVMRSKGWDFLLI